MDKERFESLEPSLNKEQQNFEELKQQLLECKVENQTLKRQIMFSQEELRSSRQQVTTSREEAKNFKKEVDGLEGQLKTFEKFKKGTEALDKVPSLQIFPSNKYGLGYDQVHMLKGQSPIIQVDEKNGYYKQEGQKSPKYKSAFYGYCFCCNNYGHKASNCQAYGKHNKIRRNHNPCGPFPNYLIECNNCHNYGHISRRCTT